MGDVNANMLNILDVPRGHLCDIFQTYQLSQLIDEPTRTTSESSTLIDIFITNNKETIVHSGVYPLSISDHCPIYAVRKVGISKNKPKFITTRSFKHFNEEKFKTDLSKVDWPVIDMFDDVDKAWDNWKDKFISIVDNHAPLRTIRVRNKPVPWINNMIKFQLYRRDMLEENC